MLTPGLSMLWEPGDARTALRYRFGLDGLEAARVRIERELAESWGLPGARCDRVVISDRNVIAGAHCRDPDGAERHLVVKWSAVPERFARLDAVTRVLTELGDRGLPVVAPVPAVDGSGRVVRDGPAGPLSWTVMPEVTGDWLDVHDERAVRDAGVQLARLHDALARIREPELEGPTGLPDLRTRVMDWLRERDHGRVPEASARLRALTDAVPDLEGDVPQLVHRDYRSANLLVRGSRVVGILDLDEIQVDHRVQDLAQAATYLATRFRDWGPTTSATREWLLAGYESVRPLGEVERAWVEVLVLRLGLATVPAGADPQGWAGSLSEP